MTFYNEILRKNKELVAMYSESASFQEHVEKLSQTFDKDMLILLAYNLKDQIVNGDMSTGREATGVRTLLALILAIKEIEKEEKQSHKTI